MMLGSSPLTIGINSSIPIRKATRPSTLKRMEQETGPKLARWQSLRFPFSNGPSYLPFRRVAIVEQDQS